MVKAIARLGASLILLCAIRAYGAGWQTIPIVTAIPAANTEIASAFPMNLGNVIEIRGLASAGTKQLILLRRCQIDGSNFQWQPFAVDKSINPSENTDAAGWFWDRFYVPDQSRGEYFALYNPGGNLTLSAVLAREVRY